MNIHPPVPSAAGQAVAVSRFPSTSLLGSQAPGSGLVSSKVGLRGTPLWWGLGRREGRSWPSDKEPKTTHLLPSSWALHFVPLSPAESFTAVPPPPSGAFMRQEYRWELRWGLLENWVQIPGEIQNQLPPQEPVLCVAGTRRFHRSCVTWSWQQPFCMGGICPHL